MVEKRINVSIDHSDPTFFCDRVVVSHSPTKFILDFTQTSPRFDFNGENLQEALVVKHRTIMLDPMVAKDFLSALHENVAKFEKAFKKIEVPKQKKHSHPIKEFQRSTEPSKYIG